MLAVGLMSGTSLDGVDAVLCTVEGTKQQTIIKQLHFITYPMPQNIREKIQLVCTNKATTDCICSLNFELGALFGEAVLELCRQAGVDLDNLDFIASHGQTIYHIPNAQNGFVRSTMQIGEPAVIAQMCNTQVVANFRTQDMAAGGQGAPLVPFSEYVLYKEPDKQIGLQNIGGISNLTVLPKDDDVSKVYAFDQGPGNMIIDEAMKQLYQKSYDANGNIARTGTIIASLQQELKQHPYIVKTPPKTTGREDFGKEFATDILERYQDEAPQDIIATLTWFTAYCIAENCKAFGPEGGLDELIVGGGGAHNSELLRLIQQQLPQTKVCTQEEKNLSSDAKEALAFVVLANQTLHGLPSNVPSATGAQSFAILGQITPKPFQQ